MRGFWLEGALRVYFALLLLLQLSQLPFPISKPTTHLLTDKLLFALECLNSPLFVAFLLLENLLKIQQHVGRSSELHPRMVGVDIEERDVDGWQHFVHDAVLEVILVLHCQLLL